MEDTLIKKVNKLEKEAEDRIAQVRQERNEQLLDLKAAEDKVLEDIKKQAEAKGEKIVAGLIARVKNDINQMKQDRENTVKSVHEQAGNNMVDTTAKTVELFKESYITKK